MTTRVPTKSHHPPASILCVEDDVDTCEFLAVLLREFSFEYTHTISAALDTIGRRRDHLYILDNWLPDGSGVELCREIKRLHPETPIVFTSAAARQPDIDEAIGAGADRYLLKPCEPDELKEVVKELLRKPAHQ